MVHMSGLNLTRSLDGCPQGCPIHCAVLYLVGYTSSNLSSFLLPVQMDILAILITSITSEVSSHVCVYVSAPPMCEYVSAPHSPTPMCEQQKRLVHIKCTYTNREVTYGSCKINQLNAFIKI